jgi:hypothetical protein
MSRVETQKHAHLLTAQNPCWHCETHLDRDPDMSAWFLFGLQVIHSVVEQTVEMFLVDWISTLVDLPPFEGNICLLPVTSIGGLIFELICPWLWMEVWTWLCIFPTWLMCPVPVHGLNLICLLICLFWQLTVYMAIDLDSASYRQLMNSLGAEIGEVLHQTEVFMVYE